MKKRIVGIKEKIQEITILVKEYVNSKKIHLFTKHPGNQGQYKNPKCKNECNSGRKKKQPGQKHR